MSWRIVVVFGAALSTTSLVGCNDFFTKDIVMGAKTPADGGTGGGSGTPQPDDDGDGLSNSVESTFKMEAQRADSDGDGFGDGLEFVSEKGDPLNSQSTPKTENRAKTLPPSEVTTGEVDSDNDGLGDSFEKENALEEDNPDTDEDGYTDGLELVANSDPFVATNRPTRTAPPAGTGLSTPTIDQDADGLSESVETRLGSSATNADSDNDGFSDGIEYLMGSELDDPASVPNFRVPEPPPTTTTVTSTTVTTTTVSTAS